MINLRTLVLNPSYEPVNLFPLYTIRPEDAIVRVMHGNAILAESFPRKVLTPSRDDLYWPSIIVNRKIYNHRYREARLKQETLFYRDNGKCQYCNVDLHITTMTCDHVIPQSKGGNHTWKNVVAACKKCNAQKDNKMPIGKWKPLSTPHEPSLYELIEKRKKFPIVVDDMKWIDYFGNWNSDVKIRPSVERMFKNE